MLKKIFNFRKNPIILPSTEDKIYEMFDSLSVDELVIHLGEDLVPFADTCVNEIWKLREKLNANFGYIIPAIRLIDNTEIQANEFCIYVRGKSVFIGYAIPNEQRAVDEIINALEKACFDYIDLIFSIALTEKYINIVEKTNSLLIYNITRVLSVTGIKLILTDLIKNGMSIKDINFVFEKICEIATQKGDFCTLRDANDLSFKIRKSFV